ncbi:MAG: hypothetical protein JWO31_3272, partial [Phycisphaerales bacterium]|nr:hypothetical protein [Phycisphaerales bacterium]
MRLGVGLAAVMVLAAASAAAGWRAGQQPGASAGQGSAVTSVHAGLALDRVRELAELVTLRADVADVQETAVAGRLGRLRIVLVVRGDVALGVDLAAATWEAVDERARAAVLVLPAPRAATARVDHAKTRVAAVAADGLWAVVPGDAAARARAVDAA